MSNTIRAIQDCSYYKSSNREDGYGLCDYKKEAIVRHSILSVLKNETASKIIAGILLFTVSSFSVFLWSMHLSINEVQANVEKQRVQIESTQAAVNNIQTDVRDIRNYFLKR